MKIMTLLLMIAGISVAQAEARQIYKCPGKVEGKFTYQERPCQGAKADEHTLKILFTDEKKRLEAQAKAAKEAGKIESNTEKAQPTETTDPNSSVVSPEQSLPATGNGDTNNNTTPPMTDTALEAAMVTKTGVTRPAPVIATPKSKK